MTTRYRLENNSDMAKRKQRTTQTNTTKARPKSRKGPRTASGKKANPVTLADAEQTALDGLRERTEEGHKKAGRTPPSHRRPRQNAAVGR